MVRGLPFAAGLLVALGAGWIGFPRVIYKSVPQPVAFSHKVHADKAGAKCEDCHSFREDGTYAGMPTLDKCSSCHAAAMGTTAEEKKFIDQYVTPGREPEWVSYARQPENVFFSHAAHVKRGKMKCEQCHGNQGASETLRPVQIDRVGGYTREVWQRGTMDDCVACHRQHNQENSCLDCHK
jgi:hypothetical protein